MTKKLRFKYQSQGGVTITEKERKNREKEW